jgi:hypothetical protein
MVLRRRRRIVDSTDQEATMTVDTVIETDSTTSQSSRTEDRVVVSTIDVGTPRVE